MANQVTFEDGYQRLHEITRRLDENPTVHETTELFREGKGLEKALREYLSQTEAELAQIEAGEGLESYEIVAPGAASPSAASADRAQPVSVPAEPASSATARDASSADSAAVATNPVADLF